MQTVSIPRAYYAYYKLSPPRWMVEEFLSFQVNCAAGTEWTLTLMRRQLARWSGGNVNECDTDDSGGASSTAAAPHNRHLMSSSSAQVLQCKQPRHRTPNETRTYDNDIKAVIHRGA